MTRFSSWLRTILFAATAALTSAAFAQGGPQEGRDYNVIPQQPTQSPGKIEVVEFFQYGCGACFQSQPVITEWEKKLPADVAFRRSPLSFDPSRISHVRMYYVLESLNRLSDLHMRAFNSMHLDKRFLVTPEDQADYFSKFGVDKAKYMELYNSFTVQTKANAAMTAARNFKVEGTPALIIDGRFLARYDQVGAAAMMRTVDALVDQVRKQKGMKPAAPAAKPAAATKS